MDSDKPDVKDILQKYGAKLEGQIKTTNIENSDYSREYLTFKKEMSPEFSRYERWCHSLGNFIRLKVSAKDEKKIRKSIDIAHLGIEPWQAISLSVMSFITIFLIGFIISLSVGFFGAGESVSFIDGFISSFPFGFFIMITFVGVFVFYFMQGYPKRLANKWRLKASSQMVPAILYIVVYMRHTSNLEKAISFASQHLQPPLSLDFRKIFYDVEVGKFSTIKDSLDSYLEGWRDYSVEFIEAFHLIESSLFEPDNSRRISTLEKSLQVILDGVYDKMLKFSHGVRSPLTNVYMLGVVLPTLALALLPLASAMVGGLIQWWHLLIFFNMIVPFFVYYLTDKIVFLRPGGYGNSAFLERNQYYSQYTSKKPYLIAFLICLPLFILGFLPLIFQYTPIPGWIGVPTDFTFEQIGLSILGTDNFFDFKTASDGIVGPFGVGALVLSLFFSLGLALFFVISYRMKTKMLIKERRRTDDLEKEFNNSLFQLGNRIGNGVPPELVFARVAESARGLKTEDFFKRVNYNIQQMGMSVESAIFDPARGVIKRYPSDLISTSMRILIEASKKGLNIAAISLMSISEYIKNIQKITNRLRDLLAEIISDMRSNMTFLAPLLSGVVVGLAAMITSIINKLSLSSLETSGVDSIGSFSSILQIFDLTKMIPPYYLQLIVGIYLVQIIFILTNALVIIDSGEDRLQRTYSTGNNLKRGMLLFFLAALFATLALSILSSVVLGSL